MSATPNKIAIFIDFENLETGVRKQYDARASMDPIIARMSEFGVTAVRKAYGDWVQHSNYRHPLLQSGVDLVERPNVSPGKNGADIRLSIDAVELAVRNPDIQTFVIVSGNSDFLPLMHKLREIGKTVFVIGVEACTSNLLRNNCDQYFAYDTLATLKEREQKVDNDLIRLLERAILTSGENEPRLRVAVLRQQLQQLDPAFNEEDHGFATFNDLLEFVAANKLIPIKLEFRDGGWEIDVTGKISLRQAPPKAVRQPAKKGQSNSKKSKPKPKKKPEPPKEEWEDREMTEEEWEALLEAIAKCIREGEGKSNQGKLWIINAYLHRQRVDGRLPLANNVLHDAIQQLTEADVLVQTSQDSYLLADDFDQKKEDFLDDLFGIEIVEEVLEVIDSEEDLDEIAEAEMEYAAKARAEAAAKAKKSSNKKGKGSSKKKK